MTENKNVILSARDIVVEFDVRDRVLTAIRGFLLIWLKVRFWPWLVSLVQVNQS